MTVVEAFAEFAAGFVREPLPQGLAHHAKRAVIDWFASLLPGAVVQPATLLEKALSEELGIGSAKLAMGRLATARAAALINGTAAHTVEVDDIYREAIYHPGAPTIAAALAAAEASAASGERFLKSVIAGYEISTRIGAAMGRAHYKYWHNTGTIGTFGAAAAAASVYGLDAKGCAHALATAATRASGLQQAFRSDSMSKPLHAGHAAESGLLAAMAAKEGVTGARDIIEGEAGFARAMGERPDFAAGLATLGKDFNIAAMTVKNHACCGHTFAAIDGALELQRRLGAKASDIARLRVETYGEALHVAGNANPKTAAEARFSVFYVVATALTHGSVRLAAFEDKKLFDPLTRDLMAKTQVILDKAIDADFPKARMARVTIELKDGRREIFLQPTRKGDPDMPLSDGELDEKFLELATPVIGQAKAKNLLQRLWRLETLRTLDLH